MDLKKLNPETRECIRAVIECIDDGIFITDGQGNVIDMNREAEGCQNRKDIIGRNMKELVESGVYEDSVALRAIKSKMPVSMVQHEEVDILTTAIPYIENDEVKMVICCEREMNELSALKEQLKDVRERNQRYKQELLYARAELTKDEGIVAESAAMKAVISLAITAAEHDSKILIQGETGTGKEVLAKLIYRRGARNSRPFVAVNCGAVPENLLESELFGYDEGAFTGARAGGKRGYFELADGGVLFLDEIGETSLNFQKKLLRCIQEEKIMRVGGNSEIPVDVQIIAATNSDLKKKVEAGEFREDLYYRLNVFPIVIPPLRERKADVAAFAYRFLEELNDRYDTEKRLSKDALDLMKEYRWPGNVRELENLMERLVIVSDKDVITRENVMQLVRADGLDNTEAGAAGIGAGETTLDKEVERFEKIIIQNHLRKSRTRIQAAESLGISFSTLKRKMRKYGL